MVVPPIEVSADHPPEKQEGSAWENITQMSRSKLSRFLLAILATTGIWLGLRMKDQHEHDERERNTVEKKILENRYLLSPFLYQVSMDQQDEKLVADWKKEVDKLIEETQRKLRDGSDATLAHSLGEHPTQRDIVLSCISRFICGKRKSSGMAGVWHTEAAAKLMWGGTHHLRELGTNFDTCVDTAAATTILARQYGIEGSVQKPGTEPHYHWQSDTGQIIDAFYLYESGGYAKDAAVFKTMQHAQPHTPPEKKG